MDRWEYLVICDGMFSSKINIRLGGTGELKRILYNMNVNSATEYLGTIGWELVSWTPPSFNHSITTVAFKRKIQ